MVLKLPIPNTTHTQNDDEVVTESEGQTVNKFYGIDIKYTVTYNIYHSSDTVVYIDVQCTKCLDDETVLKYTLFRTKIKEKRK